MIRGAFRRLSYFLRSLTGQIFLMLTVGMSVAAMLALLLAEQSRRFDFERLRMQRVLASAFDVAQRLHQQPGRVEAMLVSRKITGAIIAPPDTRLPSPNMAVADALRKRLGPRSAPEASEVPTALCFPQLQSDASNVAAGLIGAPQPDCWVVRFTDESGVRRSLGLFLPRLARPPSILANPLYLLLIVISSAGLAIIVGRLVTSPLRSLEHAAEAFSVVLDPEEIPERGPEEVRAALSTFNLMQRRVRSGFTERTQLLAAISHDLQTPLTRLRLRLELVEDEELRNRLLQDHQAMQTLVREGLDLAASTETHEEWSTIDLDSLLLSLVEDAQDLGAPMQFTGGCGGTVRVKPNALIRCLTNLGSNAIKYGDSAEISSRRQGGRVLIHVRDRGPGIPADQLDKMFEPFTRGVASQPGGRPGTGIGLTIARSLALTFDASVRLSNMEDGGLLATIDMRA